MDHRKHWTQQQTQLRRLLSSTASFEAGRKLFLSQHAVTHSGAIAKGPHWSLEDEALAGLTDAQVRYCPPGGNSIAWLLWHSARIEDITLTFLVLEQPEVIGRGKWMKRLKAGVLDVGAGMLAADVEAFSKRVSIPALKAYRAAVGVNTQRGVQGLQAGQLKELVPLADIQQLLEEGSITWRAPWLAEFYSNRRKGFFLTRTATSHNFLHLSQAKRLRLKLLSGKIAV